MAVNVVMGVDISGFNNGIKQGQSILKGLNAEMKAADAAFKLTGNAEQQLAAKTKALTSQLQIQKGIADQAEQAMQKLAAAGIEPTNQEYQRLYATMVNATAGMNNAQAELNALSAGAQSAADGADQLSNSMQSLGKKVSLDQVISGINSITNGLENAAKKAVKLGQELWNNIMDSAMLADDIATQARVFDMTPEQYQQYKGVFDTIGEVTMQEWANVRRKVEKAMEDPSNDQIDVLTALGFGGMEGGKGYAVEEQVRLTADNWEDAFWDVATEIKNRVESGEISLATADVWGEAMFGKKYANLKTLIDMGPEAFAEALKTISTASEEAIEKDAALNDTVIKLKGSFDALKLEVTSALAPALTSAAEALDGLLQSLLEYLQTEEGQEMLQGLGDSVSKLFEGMKDINAEDVVSGFKTAFDSVMDVLTWIVDNKDTVVGAVEGIFGVWGTLKVGSGVLTILKVINGLKDLMGMGGGATATEGGGFLASGFMNFASSALSNVAPALQIWASAQGGPIYDWLTHESPIAGLLNGSESLGEWWETRKKEVEKNAETFAEDWENNEIVKAFTDRSDNQDAADRLPEGADWRPSYMQEMTPEETVEIPAELESETSAADLAAQVGTVTVGVELAVEGDGGIDWRPSYMRGYANGINYVPYDGMLARLHKGEQVVPAREVQSRSYNSNLYVESMYMNNGMDAAGLASAMAAAQQRQMSGFGS